MTLTQVTHMSENTTWREHAGHHLGCFYSGSVDGDPSSAVSVSLCHGMVSQRSGSSENRRPRDVLYTRLAHKPVNSSRS